MATLAWLTVLVMATGLTETNHTRRSLERPSTVWFGHFYSPHLLQHLDPPFKQERCVDARNKERYAEIEKSECREPRDVFITMNTPTYLKITPHRVWVRRCVGYCRASFTICEVVENNTLLIPVSVYDVRTNKFHCAQYPVTEHLSCTCNYG